MRICPYCAHSNGEGEFFCEDCGEVLLEGAAAKTATRQFDRITTQLIINKNTWGTARFTQDAQVIIRVRDVEKPISIEVVDETTLGRADAATNTTPGVDLTPYGAQDLGVSRMHAAIRRGEETLTLVDLGSANGTFLNGQRLVAEQPRVLRDGDEIRVGKLVCHIFFKYYRTCVFALIPRLKGYS